MSDPRLPFDGPEPVSEPPARGLESRLEARDREGRARAVDPRHNVALEASAGTGKTTVLVTRYVNLLDHGVDPANILAVTFTRKAAAEMRERIVTRLHEKASTGEIPAARWRHLRDRLGDVAISTIDAFCLSLLREFPLEADLDPGFAMADETEVPRLIDESLDRALQVCRHLAREDDDVALVFAHLGDRRVREGLATLLHRRIAAPHVLARYLETAPPGLDVAAVTARAAAGLLDVFEACRGGLEAFVDTGAPVPAFELLARDLRRLRDLVASGEPADAAWLQAALSRAGDHLLTQQGEPRKGVPYLKAEFASDRDYQAHKALVVEAGPRFEQMQTAHRRDLNMLAARGLRRMFAVASDEYRRTLDAHAALDFADVLQRALDLLRQMEEFSRSRFRLESRYQHVLVDEFQDTSRAQWELVRLLVQAWGEGLGVSAEGPLLPSIFIVGDRKQSIYGFREADVSILREAGRHLGALRSGDDVRRSISRSFRSAPPLLAFVNDVCADMDKASDRPDGFAYDEQDRFPLAPPDEAAPAAALDEAPVLGLVTAEGPDACADAVADEIARLVDDGVEVRDRGTGLPRPVRPGDISVLFRTREAHRELEQALERRGLPVYVYKGLGFYDADEVKDVLAILRYLADPFSDLRAAALARSRLVRLSDEGLRRLAPRIAQALRGGGPGGEDVVAGLDESDRAALARVRPALARWRGLVDRVPPADLLDRVLAESAYAMELGGPRVRQARENLKKIRALVRRVENRGYATLDRIAAYLDRLSVGEEPNAVIDALDAVNLMTVHAAKGLEFPVVFVVNLNRGTGGRPAPVRVSAETGVPGVGVGSFQSEADEDRVPREREETKRLVYVALTRARDRLYLGAVRKDGGLVVGRGSLAEVLPTTLIDAVKVGGDTWTSRAGVTHRFRVVGAGEHASTGRDQRAASALRPEDGGSDDAAARAGTDGADDLDRAALPDALPLTTVTALIAPASGAPVVAAGAESSQLVGTLVHRMLEHLGASAAPDADDTTASLIVAARRLLTPDEAGAPDDTADVCARAADLFTRIRRQPDVARLYAEGERFHEVPFSLEVDGRAVRGAIDCLVREGGRVTILEFKTGRRRVVHDEQIALYRRAAEGLFPEATVEARVVYPEGAA